MILLILSGIFYGTMVPSIQILSNLGLSSYEIGIATISVSSILFFLISVFKKETMKRRDVKFFILFGLVNTLLNICLTSSVSLGTSIVIVTLLLYTQPLWTSIFGRMFFKEEITKWKIVSLIIVIAGTLILVSPWGIRGNLNPLGILLGFLSGPLYSLFLIMGKETTNRKIHYTTSIFGFSIFTVVWLLIMFPFCQVIIKNDILTRLDIGLILKNSLEIILIGIITRMVPQTLLYKSLTKIKISTAGIVLLLEPITASILAYFLFNQAITQSILIGGFLIILSNYIVIKKNE